MGVMSFSAEHRTGPMADGMSERLALVDRRVVVENWDGKARSKVTAKKSASIESIHSPFHFHTFLYGFTTEIYLYFEAFPFNPRTVYQTHTTSPFLMAYQCLARRNALFTF